MSKTLTDSSSGAVASEGSGAAAEENETEQSATGDESVESADESDSSDEQDESSEGDDSDSDEGESESEEDPKPKKKNGVKKRIDKLRGRLTEREQENAYLRQELERLRTRKQDDVEERQPSRQTEAEPNEDDFDSHKDYLKALTRWELKQEKLAEEEKKTKEQKRSEYESRKKTHNEKVAKFKETQADYQDVVEEFIEHVGNDYRVSPALEEMILDAENGPELFYELAKNPAEFERVNKLSYGAMGREIGKLEARLASAKEAKAKKQVVTKSNAPAPLKTVAGSGTGGKRQLHEARNFAEYEKIRNEQLKSKR